MSHIFCFLFPEPIPVTPSGCFGWKKEGWIFFCGSAIPTLTLIRKCFPVLIWRRKCVEHSFPFPATDTQSLCEGRAGDAHTGHTTTPAWSGGPACWTQLKVRQRPASPLPRSLLRDGHCSPQSPPPPLSPSLLPPSSSLPSSSFSPPTPPLP